MSIPPHAKRCWRLMEKLLCSRFSKKNQRPNYGTERVSSFYREFSEKSGGVHIISCNHFCRPFLIFLASLPPVGFIASSFFFRAHSLRRMSVKTSSPFFCSFCLWNMYHSMGPLRAILMKTVRNLFVTLQFNMYVAAAAHRHLRNFN